MFPRWDWLFNLVVWGAVVYTLWVAVSAVVSFI